MAEPLMFQINLLYDEMIPFGLFEDQQHLIILQVTWNCPRHRQNISGSKVIIDHSLHCACKRVPKCPLHCSRCHTERDQDTKQLVSWRGGIDGMDPPKSMVASPIPPTINQRNEHHLSSFFLRLFWHGTRSLFFYLYICPSKSEGS